jgi:hypothetical protein
MVIKKAGLQPAFFVSTQVLFEIFSCQGWESCLVFQIKIIIPNLKRGSSSWLLQKICGNVRPRIADIFTIPTEVTAKVKPPKEPDLKTFQMTGSVLYAEGAKNVFAPWPVLDRPKM